MSEDEREVSEEELDEANGEPLPDRDALSIITPTPGEDLWTTPVEKPGT